MVRKQGSCSWNHEEHRNTRHDIKRMDMVTRPASTKAVSSSKVKIYMGRMKEGWRPDRNHKKLNHLLRANELRGAQINTG